MTVGDDLFLIVAGAVAGVVGTSGGITSLVSYPALLAVGIAPLLATMTNVAALVVCLPGSALASRPELRGSGHWLARWALVAMAGGTAGAALLLTTPPRIFAHVVPFLLILASSSLLFQPRLSSWRERRGTRPEQLLLPGGLFGVSLYNGYFGAGAGIMTLALVLVAVEPEVARANALKNVLVGAATVVSAVAFICFGQVAWSAAWALALGMFAGSTLGPGVARRIPGSVLRTLAALSGVGLAIWFWVTAG